MKNTKFWLSAMILLSLVLTGLNAQVAIPATGGAASGEGGSSSYSVGQVVYTSHEGVTGSVAHGVQQPYEISTLTAIEDAQGIDLHVKVYPNPASDFLTLRVVDFDLSGLSYLLFDMNGRLLQNEKVTGNETGIKMGDLAPATYFIKVIQGQEEIKSFKIVKK